MVQTTTIDPGSSYGGLIVLEKFKVAKQPQKLELIFKRHAGDADGYHVAYMIHK